MADVRQRNVFDLNSSSLPEHVFCSDVFLGVIDDTVSEIVFPRMLHWLILGALLGLEMDLLTLLGNKNGQFCDRVSRRNFITIGALGLGGLSLDNLLRAEAQSSAATDCRSVIMIYLAGGPTQHETFDPKPNAPDNVRGSYGSIATSLPGVHFCELVPKLATRADKFSIVRTLTGMKNRHESFQCYTGRPGGRNEDDEPAGGWPGLGSVVSSLLGPTGKGIPPYVDASPKMSYGPYNNRGLHDATETSSWPGFTGYQHTPFASSGDGHLQVTLKDGNRLKDRFALSSTLGRLNQHRDRAALDTYQEQAFDILTSPQLAKALDLESEDPAVLDRYGEGQESDPSFGGPPQSPRHLLLARRLVEVGVRCVTVAFGAWDWHSNREGTIEKLAKKYLPVFDHALTVFLDDLEQRGLMDKVSVVVCGEFGRTPRINAKGGRDHWPATQSILLTGGGIQAGQVIGTTDRMGGYPIDRPVHVQEVFATLYGNLGIDPTATTLPDLDGRPRHLVEGSRQPITELC